MEPNFLRLLRQAWGMHKLQNTSVPLTVLTMPYLKSETALPVKKEENPLWHEILQPSAIKLFRWLQRTDGRFNTKMAETCAKGKTPNLRNHAHLYRDDDKELAWRMSGCFTHFEKDMEKRMSENKKE